MTHRMLWALGLTLVLAAPGGAAGEVRRTFKDGRVVLVARDATLREIIVNGSASAARASSTATGARHALDLEFSGVTEDQALTTLLRPIAVLASRRLSPDASAWRLSRIVLMPAVATPRRTPLAPAQPWARPAAANPGWAARHPGVLA